MDNKQVFQKITIVSLAAVFIFSLIGNGALAADKPSPSGKNPTQVKEIISLLKKTGHKPVILKGQNKKDLVVVAPDLVGRVMCSSYDGEKGITNAYINEKQIIQGFSTSGKGAWNNFGGAERIWFAPEGGKYGFFFDPGVEQNWDTYRMNYPLHEQPYKIVKHGKDKSSVTFQAPVELTNYISEKFHLDVTRKITVLESCPFTVGLGNRVNLVGFESKTWAKNTGDKPFKKENQPLSLWTIGQFNSTNSTVVLFPFKKGPVSQLGEPVTTEYFRYFLTVPKDDPTLAKHWSVKDGCVLIKPDGKVQMKLEMLKKRCLGRLASIDLKDFTMTIVSFNVFPELDYTTSFFLPFEGNVLNGGVMSSFMNNGEPGNSDNTAMYELETCSPILELQPNEQFCHVSHTYQIKGDQTAMTQICERFFNVDLNTLQQFVENASPASK